MFSVLAGEGARNIRLITWNASLAPRAGGNRAARCKGRSGYEVHNNAGQTQFVAGNTTTNLTQAITFSTAENLLQLRHYELCCC